MQFTKRTLDRLPLPQTGYAMHWDDTLRGFGVRVTSTGIKAFIYQRRIQGRDRRITIGRYGELTVDQARREAQRLAGEIASGKNPIAEKQRRCMAEVTLKQAFDAYLASRPLKQSTRQDMQQAMKGFSDWMRRPLISISREMVTRRHRALGERSEARANLAMRYLRAILNFAAAEYTDADGQPLLKDNPVTKLSATRSWFRVARRRGVIKPHELTPWMQAVLRLDQPPPRQPGEGKHKPTLRHGATARDYFLLVLLTGLRRNEALLLRWEDVDLVGRTLTVPDPKNRTPHTLPLSGYLLALLQRRRQATNGAYVFADAEGRRLQNLRYAQERVQELSGVCFTIHDLRRTFATIADSLDIPGYAVKALLNHKQGSDVTAGYIITDVERLRQPMARISDYILRRGGIQPPDREPATDADAVQAVPTS